MKIISIVGTRPQFIKLAPLNQALIDDHSLEFIHKIIHTGQHSDNEMSNLFFEQLEIPEPEYNLEISGGNHGSQTGKMLIGLEEVIIKEKPDLVIVFGDTNSTLAGSLVVAKLSIKSVHIEAGLRSFNKSMPEEINRIVTDHISDILFAPTNTAMKNLKTEGLVKKAFLTGDIIVDSLARNILKAKQLSNIIEILKLESGKYYLVTLHRPYTVDNPNNLSLILNKLSSLENEIVFPVHPRTRLIIENNNLDISSNIKLIKPVSYLDFLNLEQSAKKIITDSGGIQKEAYILKKPCITIRPETEWIETVEEGWNILIQPNDLDFCDRVVNFNPVSKQKDVFGSDVALKMVSQLKKSLA
jgi:UDP-GlcNAc3NAcA epimerase